MTMITRYYFTLVLMLSVAAGVFAQDQTTPPPNERLKQLRQKIEEVKYQKLRETLVLDDETAKKFFELYKPAEQEIIDLVKSRNAQELKLLELTQGDHSDADVDPTIKNIESLNQKIEDRYSKLNEQLKTVLNARQRAKLLVFEHEFNRRVREKLRQWRENHPGRPLPPKRRLNRMNNPKRG